MSCIDPVHPNPQLLRAPAPDGGDTIAPAEFERLCRQYPRLIRRIRDLSDPRRIRRNITPKEVLEFLSDNFDVPSRYEIPPGVLAPKQSLVKPWHQQFPLLPDPRERDRDWPDAQAETEKQFLEREWIDVFVVARTWYAYAQKPLPDPTDPLDPKPVEPRRHRQPKHMSSVVFRSSVARTQAYLAEMLQSEGWFAGEGWLASAAFPKNVLPASALDERLELRAGKGDPRYSSALAWQRAYDFYLDFGDKNGLYFPPETLAKLELQAREFQQAHARSGENPSALLERFVRERDPGFVAMAKLMWKAQHVSTTGFDGHLAACDAERSALAIAARRRFYEADRLRKVGAEPEALALYEEAWPLWLQVMLEHPLFVPSVEDDTYEWQMRQLRTLQSQQAPLLRPLTMGMAQLVTFPHPNFDLLLSEASKQNIIPIRTARGLLDWMQLYAPARDTKLKLALLGWVQGTGAAHGAGWLPLVPHPGHANLLLTRLDWHGARPPQGWVNLLDSGSVEPLRQRLGLRAMDPPADLMKMSPPRQ
jgi:hypothetical protein